MRQEVLCEVLQSIEQLDVIIRSVLPRLLAVAEQLNHLRQVTVLVAVAHGRVVDGERLQLIAKLLHDVSVLNVLMGLELVECVAQVLEKGLKILVIGKVGIRNL